MSVEMRGVSRWYGNVVAVNDITMNLAGGVTGLLGPNGAGKTTLLQMMAGFLPPSRGELTVAGRPSWRNPEIYRDEKLDVGRYGPLYLLVAVALVTACGAALIARYRKVTV